MKWLNFVQLQPITGRKHQLRKHLAELGFPIMGDSLYHPNQKYLRGNGLYLHATSICFTHPFLKEKISLEDRLPKKFKKLFPE